MSAVPGVDQAMKTTLDAFTDPANEAAILNATRVVVQAFNGSDAYLSLAVLFQAWITFCNFADIDAGVEFERLIATYDARKMATHRASMTVH
jgi:hypothetical protein